VTLVSVDLTRAARRRQGAEGHRPPAIFAGTRQAVAVRAVLGLGLAAGSLVLPWLGLALSPSLSAWNLKLSLGAVPLLHHLSYGMILAALLVCASVSFLRSRGRPTTCTRFVGWAFLASPLVFAVTTRLVGAATMFTLQSDASQTQIINNQFLTNNNIPPPTQFLGIQVDPKTLVLLYGLRLGWYLLLVSGVLLAGRVSRPSTRPQWIVGFVSALAALTVVLALVLGSVAQDRMNGGIQAITDGRSAAGAQLLASALRLNPSLAYDANLEQALGRAQGDEGRQTGLAQYAEAVRPVGKDLTLLQKAQLFGEAVADIPANSPAGTVVRADLATFLATATITSKNPDLLNLVGGQLGSPVVTFSVGRYYYEAGADSLAIGMLARADHETTNSEVRSLCLTYIALAWLRQGNEAAFRSNIVAAVHADRLNENVYAREIAAGLYVPGSP
jgi:hypothetical protein